MRDTAYVLFLSAVIFWLWRPRIPTAKKNAEMDLQTFGRNVFPR